MTVGIKNSTQSKNSNQYLLSFSIEGIVFGPNGTLFVASFLNDQVVRYSKDGEYLGVVSYDSFYFPNANMLFQKSSTIFIF